MAAAGQRDLAAARRQIEAGYARISQAFHQKDATGMMAPATADFRAIDLAGKTLPRADAQERLRQNFDTIRAVKGNRYIVDKITPRGKELVVNVSEKFAVVFRDSRGDWGPLGVVHTLSGTTTYRDVWGESSGGQWQMKQSRMVSSKVLVDGRPYRPAAARRPR